MGSTAIVSNLWLIPVLPLVCAALILVLNARKGLAGLLALAGQVSAFGVALVAFVTTLSHPGFREVHNITWFVTGGDPVKIGWILDPLTAAMALMVTFVGFWIFLFSTGYMAEDRNNPRFFLYLSFFSAAMLGVVIANSLLLLFVCWELVGVASYLLIGFWIHKPEAAAAARKAFITTRIGDMGLFLGMLWLYRDSGSLLFYDGGKGCIEPAALGLLVSPVVISLLIFCGAAGKSGQVPLHVWLPDAMEGPTPVSALIHAATMVAAGVFLVVRMFPLFAIPVGGEPVALNVIVWAGLVTLIFASLVAVAQYDIKRILAYSTVSQLGLMMMSIGLGAPGAAIVHLLTHGFFKALLFLGSGSVIHGCHHEQDIRRMGGLRKLMPLTFVTYSAGMLALAGVPLFFCGAWSKEEILHAAQHWEGSKLPFYLTLVGVFLTAFYMTRQMAFVFWGSHRGSDHGDHGHGHEPHESPAVMTLPLIVLAICSVVLSLVLTPAWPWLEGYLSGHEAHFELGELFSGETIAGIVTSLIVVAIGIGSGVVLYGRASGNEVLAAKLGPIFAFLHRRGLVDELYDVTVLAVARRAENVASWMDRWIWDGLVRSVGAIGNLFGFAAITLDEGGVNGGADLLSDEARMAARRMALLQSGQVQKYLSFLAGAVVLLVVILFAWLS